MGKDRLYTEKEISKIIKRAGELQAAESSKTTIGLTLEEIQHIAQDVGLEPDIVAEVASQMDHEPEQEERSIFSPLLISTQLDMEEIIPLQLTEEEWPEVVSLMERVAGKTGASSKVGRMMEWISDSKHTLYKLSLFSGDDQSKVVIQANFNQLALAWTLPIVINVAVWALLLGMLNFGMMGIPIGLSITLASYLVVRSGINSFVQKKKKSIRLMFRKLSSLVAGGQQSASKKENTIQPSLTIPPEEPEHNTGSKPERNRIR
ncbi:MAG: hypothetical protein AAFW89_06525 [Bacteroidota bacterium]